eukprot:2736212-Amphidinium_carterae.1
MQGFVGDDEDSADAWKAEHSHFHPVQNFFVDFMVTGMPREPTVLGVVDTGAVNAVAGMNTMLSIDSTLSKFQLGLKRVPPPRWVGGIGGACRVVMAVEVPVSLGSVCGTVSAVVVPGDIPFLVPLPLLKTLGAVMYLEKGYVQWRNGEHSALVTLASGHSGVSLSDHLDEFSHVVPNAHEFQRCSEHEQVRRDLLAEVALCCHDGASGSTSSPSVWTPLQPSQDQQDQLLAQTTDGADSSVNRATSIAAEATGTCLGGRGDSMCQGPSGPVASLGTPLHDGCVGSIIHRSDSGATGAGHQSEVTHARSSESRNKGG